MANAWRNMRVRSQDLCQIMRDINALQAAVSGWRVVGLVGSPFGGSIYGTSHDSTGFTWIAPTDSGAIYGVYSDDYLRRFGSDGNFQWEVGITQAHTICSDGAENVFILSRASDTIYKYDSAGNLVTSFSAINPSGGPMVCDSVGNVYLLHESSNSRLTKWDNSGALQWTYSFPAIAISPFGLAIDSSDVLHTLNYGFYLVRLDSTSGAILGTYGAASNYSQYITSDGDRIYCAASGSEYFDVYEKAGTFVESVLFTAMGGDATANSNLNAHFITFNSSFAANWTGSLYIANSAATRKLTTGQTKFHGYTTDARVSLGTPDGGATVPGLNAMYENDACFDYQQIANCQIAIQGLVRLYDYGDGYPFTFIPRAVNATILTMGSNGFGGIGFTCDEVLPINEYLTVSGVTGTTNANGTWRVVASGGFYDYALSGATYNAAWTGGGTVTDPRNLYAAAMGDRTTYGATGGTAYGWTRCGGRTGLTASSFNPCQGPATVAGTDGAQYYCIRGHVASSSTKPITGGSYATYWSASHRIRQASATWVDGQGYNTHATICQGTDGAFYYCEEDHVADATNRPASGVNWPIYWRIDSNVAVANVTWTDGASYSGSRIYDIDIGELRECVDLLMASTPL